MYSKLILRSLPVLAFIAAAQGQQPGSAQGQRFLPGMHANADELMNDRKRFLVEIYTLRGAELDKVAQALSNLLPNQQAYQARFAKTLDRMELAIAIVNNDTTISETDRLNRRAKFQRQLDEIHRKAPLSLNNVIRTTNGIVAPDGVSAAQQRMLARFGPESKGPTGQVDPMRIDDQMVRLAPPARRIELPISPPQSQEPAAAQPQLTTIQPTTPTPNPASPRAQPQPGPPPPPPVVAAPPPPPPKNYPPAPPMPEWEGYWQKTMIKYHFTDAQKPVAERIYKHCSDRAKTYQETSKADYESAEKLTGADKNATLAKLNKPLDALYGEMTERMEAVATVEQKQNAAKAQTAAAPKN